MLLSNVIEFVLQMKLSRAVQSDIIKAGVAAHPGAIDVHAFRWLAQKHGEPAVVSNIIHLSHLGKIDFEVSGSGGREPTFICPTITDEAMAVSVDAPPTQPFQGGVARRLILTAIRNSVLSEKSQEMWIAELKSLPSSHVESMALAILGLGLTHSAGALATVRTYVRVSVGTAGIPPSDA